MATDKSNRDARLDALRGLFLVIMTIDHLPSVLKEYTEESLGYVSAAEGFFFLSGYVSALVYGRYLDKYGPAMLWRHALRRAARIYCYNAFALLLLLVLAAGFGVARAEWHPWIPLFYDQPGLGLLLGLTLLYQPFFFGILPMYCGFSLLTPLVLRALRSERKLLVPYLSLCLWCLSQLGMMQWVAPGVPAAVLVNLGGFCPWSWQLLFVIGLFLGVHGPAVEAVLRPVRGYFRAAVVTIAVAGFLLRHNLLPLPNLNAEAYSLAIKGTLGPVRLLNTLALGCLLSAKPLWPAGAMHVRALAYLGRKSLIVYTWHLLLLYLMQWAVWGRFALDETARVAVAAGCVLSLYAAVWISSRVSRIWAVAEGAPRGGTRATMETPCGGTRPTGT